MYKVYESISKNFVDEQKLNLNSQDSPQMVSLNLPKLHHSIKNIISQNPTFYTKQTAEDYSLKLADYDKHLLDKEISYKMFSPLALSIAKEYLDEEESLMRAHILENSSIDSYANLIVIGAGPLRYLKIACLIHKRYIAIDKYLDIFIDNNLGCLINNIDRVELIYKPFEELLPRDLPPEKSIFIFTFNVFSYIKNAIHSINEIIDEGNIIYITGWGGNSLNKMVTYFQYVFENAPALQRNISTLSDIYQVNFNDIKKARKVERYEGKFSKAVIIYT